MTSKASGNKRKIPTAKKVSHGAQAITAKSKDEALTKLESTGITPDERSQMIAEAAYYRAEIRGFDPKGQVQDWLEAESEVDTMLSKSRQENAKPSH